MLKTVGLPSSRPFSSPPPLSPHSLSAPYPAITGDWNTSEYYTNYMSANYAGVREGWEGGAEGGGGAW